MPNLHKAIQLRNQELQLDHDECKKRNKVHVLHRLLSYIQQWSVS